VNTTDVLRRLFFIAVLASAPLQAAVTEQAVELTTPGGKLAGTLTLPEGTGRVPAALIIAGSGPTDRDGNGPGGRNDSLRLLAQALGEAGIATVRYDKRGIAASAAAGPRESDLRFDMYVDDAAAWLAQMRRNPRFSRIGVVGHSEGALIGMLAAKAAKADAYVSLAGIAEPAPAILRVQLKGKLPPALSAESERILVALEDGKQVAEVSPALHVLYRPSVQPYLISWFTKNPSTILPTLAGPVLIVQGSTDIQVAVGQAQALQRARPQATLHIVEGMNHVLKSVPADQARQLASYTDVTLPLAPGLAAVIAAFLR
jgi:hypothetical protein